MAGKGATIRKAIRRAMLRHGDTPTDTQIRREGRRLADKAKAEKS